MFQYRQVLARLRQGDSDRDIARARLMGRPKVAALRALAAREGWLATDQPLPDDAVIAVAVGQARRARSTISSVEPFRAVVTRWAEQGVNGEVIHAALCREHGYTGSYSAVRRMLGALATTPPRGHSAAAVRAGRGGAGPDELFRQFGITPDAVSAEAVRCLARAR